MLQLIPIRVKRQLEGFDIYNTIGKAVGEIIEHNDILVVSSKFVAISEKSVVILQKVKHSREATRLSKKYGMNKKLVEVIQRESDFVVGGVHGFILTIKDGMLCPNAGVDRSNIEKGKVVLYPREPATACKLIKDYLKFRFGVDVGVVLSDSRLMPMRKGTTGVAVASAGIKAILEMRGNMDLFGNVLRVTVQSLADDVCSAAQLLMGESDESVPIVIVRGLNVISDELYHSSDFTISPRICVYIRSFRERYSF